MFAIASIDRVRQLKEEISALVKLNALYNANSRPSVFTFKTHQLRRVRLVEIREELGAMKRSE